jgi:biotin carboxylase
MLLYATTGYEGRDFLEAARRLETVCVLGTDRCHVLEDPWGDGALPVRFEEPEKAARAILEYARTTPLDAIIPVGDKPTLVAALASARLGLPHNPPEAAEVCRNKFLARQRFREAGLPVPWFTRFPIAADPRSLFSQVRFPCILKPLCLSASQGVIRADDPEAFATAFRRVRAVLSAPTVRRSKDPAADWILVEGYIPGREVAVEALLDRGRLRPLALFDKPDPLDGPYFEETIYVTPSRLSQETQANILASVTRAAGAIGLVHGPIHAELRLNEAGPWILEVAARAIGGLCPRVLRFGTGISLEELIIRHALGMDVTPLEREAVAAGVMMIPIPQAGILRRVRGIEAARRIPGIADVTITAKLGGELVPLPEGSSYLGFIFARASSPRDAEDALRRAHEELHFEISSNLPVAR